jgi:hypothetical protein
MILYTFYKIQQNIKYYWRFNLRQGPWILSDFSQLCACFTFKTPERIKALQLDPWPKGASRPAEIPASWRRSRPGMVWRRAGGSPWLDLCADLGQGGRRRARTAEQDGSGRCDLKSGGTTTFPGQCIKARAPAGPREESKVVVRRQTQAERKLGQAVAMAALRSLVCGWGAGAC